MAVDVLDDRRVAGGVVEREMDRRGIAAGGIGHLDHLDVGLRDPRDRVGHGREVVQEVLQPRGLTEGRTRLVEVAIGGLGQPQDVPGESGLVDAVDGDDVEGGGDHAAVLRRPGEFTLDPVVAGHPAGVLPQVRHQILVEVHVAADQDGTVCVWPDHPCTHRSLTFGVDAVAVDSTRRRQRAVAMMRGGTDPVPRCLIFVPRKAQNGVET